MLGIKWLFATVHWNLKNVFLISTTLAFQVVTAAPQKFKIDILPVDDGTPRIVTNLGLQWLEYMDNKVHNVLYMNVCRQTL